MPFFSLYEWLSPSNTGRRDMGTSAKRGILSVLLFLLTLGAAVLEHVIINMYDISYPIWLHWLIYGFEVLTFILLLYGIFREKLAFIIPFIIVEGVKLLLWGAFSTYYLVRLIINQINGEGGDTEPRTAAVIPGVIAVETTQYKDEFGQLHYGSHDHFSNYWLSRVLGFLMIFVTIHAIIVCVAISVYQAIRRLILIDDRDRLPTAHATSIVTVPQTFEKDAVIVTKTSDHVNSFQDRA